MNEPELEKYIPSTEFPVSEDRKLDEGADSSVYRCGDYVLKVYKKRTPPIDLEGLLLYWDITNQLAERFNEDDITYKVSIRDQIYDFSLAINPILWAGNNPANPDQLISVSKYIAGPKISDNYSQEIPFTSREFADPVTRYLEDLSDQLDKNFGVYGISIVSPNVKFNYQQRKQDEKPKIKLTITDLCSNLWALTKAGNPISPKQ